MRPRRLPFTGHGKAIGIATASALLFGVISCGAPLNSGTDPSTFHGLIINSDVSSGLFGGIRGSRPARVLALYGTFNPAGRIRELEEVVLEWRDGWTRGVPLSCRRILIPSGERP